MSCGLPHHILCGHASFQREMLRGRRARLRLGPAPPSVPRVHRKKAFEMRIVLTRREGLDSDDGVSIFIVALAQGFRDLGHEVKLVVGSLGDRAEYQRLLSPRFDLSITALSSTPLKGGASLRRWLHAKRVIDNFAPALVIHSEAVPLPLRGTVVHVVHDLEPRRGPLAPLWRSIRRFSARRADHVVATTSELRAALVHDLGMPAEKLLLIPKCIDGGAYRGLPLQARERAILHAGTLPYKNPVATIHAFHALNDASVRLYVTGAVTAPLAEAIAMLPDRLRAQVITTGSVGRDAVRKLHGQVRVAAFPTRYTVPVGSATVMEAIASGTPIVGSPRLSRDVLADRVNGIVVETKAELFAAALRSVLDDDALWRQLSEGAKRMAERFVAPTIARHYLRLAAVAQRQAHGSALVSSEALQGEP